MGTTLTKAFPLRPYTPQPSPLRLSGRDWQIFHTIRLLLTGWALSHYAKAHHLREGAEAAAPFFKTRLRAQARNFLRSAHLVLWYLSMRVVAHSTRARSLMKRLALLLRKYDTRLLAIVTAVSLLSFDETLFVLTHLFMNAKRNLIGRAWVPPAAPSATTAGAQEAAPASRPPAGTRSRHHRFTGRGSRATSPPAPLSAPAFVAAASATHAGAPPLARTEASRAVSHTSSNSSLPRPASGLQQTAASLWAPVADPRELLPLASGGRRPRRYNRHGSVTRYLDSDDDHGGGEDGSDSDSGEDVEDASSASSSRVSVQQEQQQQQVVWEEAVGEDDAMVLLADSDSTGDPAVPAYQRHSTLGSDMFDSDNDDDDGGGNGGAGLLHDDVSTIATREGHDGGDEQNYMCSICREATRSRRLFSFCPVSDSHVCHWDCMQAWYDSGQAMAHSCPVCRTQLVLTPIPLQDRIVITLLSRDYWASVANRSLLFVGCVGGAVVGYATLLGLDALRKLYRPGQGRRLAFA